LVLFPNLVWIQACVRCRWVHGLHLVSQTKQDMCIACREVACMLGAYWAVTVSVSDMGSEFHQTGGQKGKMSNILEPTRTTMCPFLVTGVLHDGRGPSQMWCRSPSNCYQVILWVYVTCLSWQLTMLLPLLWLLKGLMYENRGIRRSLWTVVVYW
jgi:hypothetical protein